MPVFSRFGFPGGISVEDGLFLHVTVEGLEIDGSPRFACLLGHAVAPRVTYWYRSYLFQDSKPHVSVSVSV